MSINIAIDGPSGAGKSSLAKLIAKQMSFVYVDTGALYRAVGYQVLNNGKDPSDEAQVDQILEHIDVTFRSEPDGQRVFVNDEDVSGSIRTMKVAMAASDVSAFPSVREFLLESQRKIARDTDVVMDGRDIGTVVLPDAQVKIFLTAAPRTRALRRMLELQSRGEACSNSLDDILEQMTQRDANDSSRNTAPLRQADDAVLLDNTDLSEEQTLAAAMKIIKDKLDTGT